MSKNISITIPDGVYSALQAKGAPLEMTAAEYLKQYTIAAGMGEVGALRLCDKVNEYVAAEAEKERAKQAAEAAAGMLADAELWPSVSGTEMHEQAVAEDALKVAGKKAAD